MWQDQDIYITSWKNTQKGGLFGGENHVAYVIRFMEQIGRGGHILGVCQPCVQALAAVTVMSASTATPLSMPLVAVPVDVRSPSSVNDLANEKPLAWLQRNVISTVPGRLPCAGRRVYPGAVQLTAFMPMNMDRHRGQHRKLYEHLTGGEAAKAQRIKDFYDDNFAVLHLTEEFSIQTIDHNFQQAGLATGDLTYRGRKRDPSGITRTAPLTDKGRRDDICGLGQTTAAHDL
ncbi:hypothetical protein GCM10011415_04260 [Salipiger pallidus]|uniref:PHB de-polymerase C-terminal domain-containing protein n=1 Tax=Salipiger pallidus TaxID=1775170 RepID=A0A8J2ZGW7_9RHOB|nr:hypothetical protein GCM10011415_04260 [Salipiger pallidus]